MKLPELFTDYLGHLFGGRRSEARDLMFRAQDKGMAAEDILIKIVWPAMGQIQELYRADAIPLITEHMATRINRQVADQMQRLLRHDMKSGRRMIVMCGEGESEELGAQILVDLLEGIGWQMWFLGAGVPNDEVLEFLSQAKPDVLCVYGTQPTSVPGVRRLIDLVHEVGVCPNMKVLASGGVFNRAEGLAEEIGADLFAENIVQAIDVIQQHFPIEIKSEADDPRRGRRSGGQTRQGVARETSKSGKKSGRVRSTSEDAA